MGATGTPNEVRATELAGARRACGTLDATLYRTMVVLLKRNLFFSGIALGVLAVLGISILARMYLIISYGTHIPSINSISEKLQARQSLRQMGTEKQQPRTLLIIQGAFRTFDHVVDSIIDNLVKANAPCDVVVSTDRELPRNSLALMKLRPYMISPGGVIYPDASIDNMTVKSSIEFEQHHRALSRVQTSGYGFIMKTRTDVVIQRPMTFTTAIGSDASKFHATWPVFLTALMRHEPSVTPEEAILSWFMMAGSPFYIIRLSRRNDHMSWSPVGPYNITKSLQHAIKENCDELWGLDLHRGWRFLLEKTESVRSLIQRLAKDEHVMYMAGNTWVGFGARQDFLKVYETIYRDYGRFSWNDWRGSPVWENHLHDPPSMVTESHWDPPPTVTESHFRLSHLHHNVSLVDLVNLADHQITFMRENDCYGPDLLRQAKGLATYILRDRQISCLDRSPSATPHRLPPEIMEEDRIYLDYEYSR